MQVVSALKYLNEIKPPIIHYDLKPGEDVPRTCVALSVNLDDLKAILSSQARINLIEVYSDFTVFLFFIIVLLLVKEGCKFSYMGDLCIPIL